MVFALTLVLTANAAQADLVGHWKLDETSGTNAVDSSGNGNDGDLYGGDTFADLTIAGKVDNAVLFNGTDDYIKGSDTNLPTGNKTISFWFRNDTDMTANQYQFTYGTKATSDWFGAYVGNNVWWQYAAGWGDDASWTHDSVAYVNGTWYHVVFTWDGSNTKFYRDTVKDAQDEAQSWSTALSGTFTMGAEPAPASYFTGAIDDVAVWDEVLSLTQISNVYLYGAEYYDGYIEMDILGTNGTSITDGDATPAVSNGTDFDSADISGVMVTNIFTVTNTGAATLSLTGTPVVAITGHTNDLSVTVQPSTSITSSNDTTFIIVFNPTVAGLRTGLVSIANDDSDENPYTFSIQGTGTENLPEGTVFRF